jgi:hypothetical protein
MITWNPLFELLPILGLALAAGAFFVFGGKGE